MPRYRKRPVDIECWQFMGSLDGAPEWLKAAVAAGTARVVADGSSLGQARSAAEVGQMIVLETPEGGLSAKSGAWIAKGVRGELYPIQDDIFRETYEQVGD